MFHFYYIKAAIFTNMKAFERKSSKKIERSPVNTA